MSLHRMVEVAEAIVEARRAGKNAEFELALLEACVDTYKSQAYRDEVREEVEQLWLRRAKEMEYGKPHTITYRRKELEFFTGAMAALQAVMPRDDDRLTELAPSAWVLNTISGLNIVEVE